MSMKIISTKVLFGNKVVKIGIASDYHVPYLVNHLYLLIGKNLS